MTSIGHNAPPPFEAIAARLPEMWRKQLGEVAA